VSEHSGSDAVDVIIVPLDGSKLSELALPVASHLAGRLHAETRILSVVARQDRVAEREAALADLEAPVQGIPMSRSVVVGLDPAAAISEALRELPRSTAVMASRGRGRSAAVVGSVANDVLARACEPVVIVGPLVDWRLRADGVLACIDGKQPPTALLRGAARWARLLHERVIVFTVAEPVPPEIHVGPVRRAYGPDGDVEAHLERVARPLRAEETDVELHAEYHEFGVVAGIRRHLAIRPASLVSLGTRPHRRVSRLVFGSLAAEVIRASASPVLVVPRPGDPRR
jgi:nucleotide-binding universal stress UspA family protein